MLRVGLTGGIGAGKSTVATRLAEHGAVLIDADAIAREVVEPGTGGLAELTAAFGEDILAADGTLDRSALAAKAFRDEASRLRLNGIMHPRIGARATELMSAAAPDAIVVHDVPLLVEGGLGERYHLVIVVDAPVETRVLRLVEVRGMAEEDARARVAAQAGEAQRRAAADVWLDNSGAPDVVLAEVDRLWADRLVPFEANIRLRRPRKPVPPRLMPYDETWPAQAARAATRIRVTVGDRALRVDHIGSTAVPGLPAKDVLDLQVLVSDLDGADGFAEELSDAGFIRAEGDWWDHAQDGSGVWPKRFHHSGDPGRPVNVHVRSLATPAWRLALLFPEWLRANLAEREAYAEVKRRLADTHDTLDGYADAKQGWVDAAFVRAEAWAKAAAWTP
ncbi:MAG TPA: dephospho-CoA kinase [Amycolatopsis sp.]|uniref:dephospho-CoA kinase n=1 Tax=Amycolatopsis sp. TaxID=37632 RepID=UPI002B494C93|nr:dephospho-CoA kinase [Amycolatopsis sp.]HKS44530.1 dephospho-CoA kinase [Amycolatopsis sp.]